MPRSNPKGTSDKALYLLRKIAEQIKIRRQALGISASVTAEAAGMSRVTLHRIEKGEPSVTMGSYLSVISALGLDLAMFEPGKEGKNAKDSKLPKEIVVAEYPHLKRLAWQLKGIKTVSPKMALGIYERNWKHINFDEVPPKERELIQNLLAILGRERLLV